MPDGEGLSGGENLARLGAQRSAAATVATATTTVGSANASATTAAGRSSIGFSDGVESEADVHVQTTYVSDALGRLVRVDSAPKLGDEVSDTAFFAADNQYPLPRMLLRLRCLHLRVRGV